MSFSNQHVNNQPGLPMGSGVVPSLLPHQFNPGLGSDFDLTNLHGFAPNHPHMVKNTKSKKKSN